MKINITKFCRLTIRSLVFSKRSVSAYVFYRRSRKMTAPAEEPDEMEYNISFPVTGANQHELKDPVVYLLGWTGATDKHLAKYSEIYEKEGFITLRYITPSHVPFSSEADHILTSTSHKLLQLLEDYDLGGHPVFFHIFSNGGALLYRFTTEVFQNANVDIIGVVMDSGPSRLEWGVGLKALYYSQKSKGLLRVAFMGVGIVLHSIVQGILARPGSKKDFYQTLKDCSGSIYPHLFLYSTVDALIPCRYVEEIAVARRNAGAIVKTVNFIDSPHVEHLRYHKKEYTELSLKFLDGCLKRYDGGHNDRDVIDFSSSVDPADYDLKS